LQPVDLEKFMGQMLDQWLASWLSADVAEKRATT
jgi:hypothetical protein